MHVSPDAATSGMQEDAPAETFSRQGRAGVLPWYESRGAGNGSAVTRFTDRRSAEAVGIVTARQGAAKTKCENWTALMSLRRITYRNSGIVQCRFITSASSHNVCEFSSIQAGTAAGNTKHFPPPEYYAGMICADHRSARRRDIVNQRSCS